MYMIFLNLAVAELDRSRSFYEALGFRIDQNSSDESTAAVVVDDTITVMLTTGDAFAGLLNGPAGGSGQPPAVVSCLSVQSREEVDQLVDAAAAAGSSTWGDDAEQPTTYVRSFADPDGHVWRIAYLQAVHVID